MKAQVIINDKYLKEHHGIYRYSIVKIVKTKTIRGVIISYQCRYKSGQEITFRPHELKLLTNTIF